MKPAIVIAAYNRVGPLLDLLDNLNSADYPKDDIPLIISVDFSDSREVANAVSDFKWVHGEKRVIIHPANLGLKRHIRFCGALTKDYGSIILLEDDLLISPVFYRYALDVLGHYKNEALISGFALYSYRIAESALGRFSDANPRSFWHLMQVPCSWGQIWTQSQWESYEAFLESGDGASVRLPEYVNFWSDHSWKKSFMAYLIKSGTYFLYPKRAYSSNPGIVGTNYKKSRAIYNVDLEKKHYQNKSSDVSLMWKYDSHFEPEWECLPKQLKELNRGAPYDLDIQGGKLPEEFRYEKVLSANKMGGELRVLDKKDFESLENIWNKVEGKRLFLGLSAKKRLDVFSKWNLRNRRYFYTTTKLKNKLKSLFGIR